MTAHTCSFGIVGDLRPSVRKWVEEHGCKLVHVDIESASFSPRTIMIERSEDAGERARSLLDAGARAVLFV